MKTMKSKRYVLTDDVYSLFSQLRHFNASEESPILYKKVGNFVQLVRKTLESSLLEKTVVQHYSKSKIEEEIAIKVVRLLNLHKNSLCVCLDRDLLHDLEYSPKYRGRFFRFQICRTHTNTKVPRHHSESFAHQIQTLKNKILENNIKELVLVDIGIFSGNTIRSIIELFSRGEIICDIKNIVTYICKPEIKKQFSKAKITSITEHTNLYEWVDLHDFTPFGGKIIPKKRSFHYAEAIPYLFPWSDGSSASLHLEPKFFSISKKLIRAFLSLIEYHDRINPLKHMTMEYLLNSGFSIPNNIQSTIPYSKNMRLVHYLKECLKIIEVEENKKVLIFDMDGTLYNYQNSDGFKNSILNNKIKINAIRFIKKKERCNLKEAKSIYEIGLQDNVGLSAYLSSKYKISRKDYFDTVWNIAPSTIIKKSSIVEQLKRLREYRLILLSSAPSVWVNSVLTYLKAKQYFDYVYCAEDFNTKDDMFRMISKRYKPNNCLSIGDQIHTDILPARKWGMKTFLVKGPIDIISTRLIETLSI